DPGVDSGRKGGPAGSNGPTERTCQCVSSGLVAEEVIAELRALGDPAAVAGMARFGIHSQMVLGVSAPKLRALAKRIGRDHALAQELWRAGIQETRAVASLIADPKQVTEELMDAW